jgi:tetratricopeptide (TPR) repeat protein
MVWRFLLVAALSVASPGIAGAQQLADEQSRRAALEFYERGQQFMAAEQFGQAAEEFIKAVARDPLLTIAHYQLGQAYMNLRRYPSAIKAYGDCIEASRALLSLASAHRFEVEKQRDDEIRVMREVVHQLVQSGQQLKATRAEQHLHDLERQRSSFDGTFRPSAEVLLALGSAHFRNGDREAAEVGWKEAIEVNPKLGEAHNNLAVIYMLTGRSREAREAVRSAERSGFRVNPQLKEDIRKLP